MNNKFKKRKNEAINKAIVDPNSIVERRNEKGKLGLVNEKTGEVVFPYGNYSFSMQSTKSESLIFLLKTNGKRETEYIGIYNKKRDKVLANHWKVLNGLIPPGSEVLWLENPVTKKVHLFNEGTYGTKVDIFDNGYSNIEFLGDFGYYPFAITGDNGKQALYTTDKGFITKFEYDNIESCIRGIILTKDKKKTYILSSDKNKKQSKEYDDIKRDSDFFYCKDGNKWDIYYEICSTTELVFTVSCDDISRLGKIEKSDGVREVVKHVFLLGKDGKYGLMEGNVKDNNTKEPTTRTLLNTEYDGISIFPKTEEVIGGDIICLLKKNNKLGLFGYDIDCSYRIEGYEHKAEAKYDRIEMVRNYDIFALYTGDTCDIYDIQEDKILLTNCDEYERFGSYIIYKTHNKKGAYSIDDDTFEYGYDDIVCLDNYVFIVEKNGKKGLFHGTKNGIEKHIEPIYKSIRVGEANITTTGYDETLYLSLEGEDGYYELNICDIADKYFTHDNLTKPDDNIYKQIKFYEHFFVTKNSRGVYVNSYDGNTVKVFEPDTEVFMDKIDTRDGRELDLLIVNGVYYVLFKGEFILVDSKNIPEYKYSYTSEYGEVGMVFHSKSEYDYFIKSTRKLSQEKMDDIFVGLYRESPKAQSNYPELKKTIGKRN